MWSSVTLQQIFFSKRCVVLEKQATGRVRNQSNPNYIRGAQIPGASRTLTLVRWCQYFQHNGCSFYPLPLLHTKRCIGSHTPNKKHQTRPTFKGHFRIVGPHHGTRFTTPAILRWLPHSSQVLRHRQKALWLAATQLSKPRCVCNWHPFRHAVNLPNDI
jgi:hypothetical protein